MSDAVRKTEEYIRKTGMLSGGGHVIMGVSGGADSVFLFYVLKMLAEPLHLSLSVLHIHHGIRGKDADADAIFVEEMCRREDVPCRVVRADVPALSGKWKKSLEETGRAVRREAFEDEAARIPGSRIALAHHRNDLAETVIFQLSRGTGLAGLGGIRPVSGRVIRPLLALGAGEIRNFLLEEKIPWREDATNMEDGPSRNRIRHHVIPYLVREVNPQAVEHIAEAAFRVQEADDFLMEECRRRYAMYVEGPVPEESGAFRISARIEKEHPAMQKAVLKEALSRTAGELKDIEAVHIGILMELLKKEEGKQADLIRGVRAYRSADGILLMRNGMNGCPREAREPSREEIVLPVRERDSGTCRIKDFIFRWEVFSGIPAEWKRPGGEIAPPEKRCVKWLDYDMINGSPVLRTRRTGDYLMINREGGHKSLSDYLTDIKMPKDMRDTMILAADGQEVMWIPGGRIGYRYRITGKTKRILKLTVADHEEGEPHG